jgi:GAF domain
VDERRDATGRTGGFCCGRGADMQGSRLHRILAELSDGGDSWSSARLCVACPGIVEVDGAGVMLMSGDIPRGSLCTSNEVSHLIEELQYTLGEGPCVDAHQQGRVVAEPDLAEPVTGRWLAFSPPAVQAGVRAVFGFPLRVGTVRLGALNLYRTRPGPLDADQHANALVIADVAARWVLEAQAGAPSDTVAEALEIGADFHFVVHNAAGIVSVQQGISVTEALIRLRAFAFSSDRLLADVAQDVVDRKLRLG